MPQFTRDRQGGDSLLDYCLSLHAIKTGSLDADAVYAYQTAELLRDALEHWEEGPPFTKAFDDAVKNLIVVALAEWDGRHAKGDGR
jgi:hypothetical protein